MTISVNDWHPLIGLSYQDRQHHAPGVGMFPALLPWNHNKTLAASFPPTHCLACGRYFSRGANGNCRYCGEWHPGME